MPQKIVVLEQMGDALRNTGYKSIENAVSEIVDNSIEASAKDIFIIVSEGINENTGRKYVKEFAFLDNGSGMDLQQLGACLGIGFTTRANRKSMGRFGVGLPQASLHVCPSVDVYSWQNGYKENCHKVFLDIDLVRTGKQVEITDPLQCKIPEKYVKFLGYKTKEKEYDFRNNGTLVHWKNCDRVSPKTIKPLFERLEFALGQKFRYLILESSHNIRLIHLENQDFSQNIFPNDPMLLMLPNYATGKLEKPGEVILKASAEKSVAIFEPYTGAEKLSKHVVDVNIQYICNQTKEIKTSPVQVCFSKVKNAFYDKTAFPTKDPGSSQIGKHVAKLEGISVVRAGREIDFGTFDFYMNINEPQHRWWGCEIRFSPELDEAFGVSNNKQYVELSKISTDDISAYEDDEIKPIWLQLYNAVHNTIKEIYAANKEVRAQSRTIEDTKSPVSDIIDIVEEGKDDSTTITAGKKENASIEALIDAAKEELESEGVDNPTDKDAEKYLDSKVHLSYRDLRKGPFFDYSFELSICQIYINTSHIFYKQFFPSIEADPQTKIAFELFLSAFIMAVNEKANSDKAEELLDLVIQEWNTKIRNYINEQTNYGK